MSNVTQAIEYPIGGSGQTLVFSPAVLDHFNKHRQVRWFQREAGGQLFARFDQSRIVVEAATGPRKTDVRKRSLYLPNLNSERLEIIEHFSRGLHFVGDWHTHPDLHPCPSKQDIECTSKRFSLSKHELNGFVFVIVGNSQTASSDYVALYSDRECLILNVAN